jgi:hypothetical protein
MKMKQPYIVSLDWLVDTMMLGKVKEVTKDYMIDISKIKFM